MKTGLTISILILLFSCNNNSKKSIQLSQQTNIEIGN